MNEGEGRRLPGSGDAYASQNRAKGRPDKYANSKKTSRYGAEQEQLNRKHDGVGQETSTGGTTPLWIRRDWALGLGRQGGGGSRNGGGRMYTIREKTYGLTGEIKSG